MTPAQRHLLAWDIAATHAALCPHCQPPSIDQPMTTRCRVGMGLDARVMGTWRGMVDALTDRLAVR